MVDLIEIKSTEPIKTWLRAVNMRIEYTEDTPSSITWTIEKVIEVAGERFTKGVQEITVPFDQKEVIDVTSSAFGQKIGVETTKSDLYDIIDSTLCSDMVSTGSINKESISVSAGTVGIKG